MKILEVLPPLLLFAAILIGIGKLQFFKLSGVNTRFLQISFTAKTLAGIGMYFLYTYYYPVRADADTFKYFDDSRILYEALWTKPADFFKMLFGIGCENDYFFKTYYVKMYNWYLAYDNGLVNDSRLIIRLNAVFRIFSFGNYHIHSLLLNFVSFTGLYALMRLFIAVSGSKWKSFLAAFAVPSVIFWSSGILKEAVLIFAIGFFSWNFYKIVIGEYSHRRLLTILLFVSILLVVKLYVFAALIIACAGLIASKFIERSLIAYLVAFGIMMVLVSIVGFINPTYSFIELIVSKQHDFIELSKKVVVHSLIPVQALDHSFWSILKSIPAALINTFTRPWISDIRGILFIPSVLENILVFLLAFFAIRNKVKLDPTKKNFVLFCFTFTIVLFLIIGLTTPIIGAIVRYKIPALPFLVFGLLLCVNNTQIPLLKSQNSRLSRLLNSIDHSN
jgi:hypothetical protein